MKSFTPERIANWFILCHRPDCGDLPTHLKIQKLVYYAQAWSLAILKRPLFTEPILAGERGPYVKSLFQKLSKKEYDLSGILPSPTTNYKINDKTVVELLWRVWAEYGCFTAPFLENLSKAELPYCLADPVISHESMSDWYQNLQNQVSR